jgi:hypothetical protein
MSGKAVISLTTGLEDPERVTVAFLVAVGAAEQGRPQNAKHSGGVRPWFARCRSGHPRR